MKLIKNFIVISLIIGYSSAFAHEQVAATSSTEKPSSTAQGVAAPVAASAVPITSVSMAQQREAAQRQEGFAAWAKRNNGTVQLVCVTLLGYLAWGLLGSSMEPGMIAEGKSGKVCAVVAQKPLQNPSLPLRLLSFL